MKLYVATLALAALGLMGMAVPYVYATESAGDGWERIELPKAPKVGPQGMQKTA